MKRRVIVWPAAGGKPETFYEVDRVVLLDAPVEFAVGEGEKVLLVNPMHLLACVVETGPPAADRPQEAPG